jgi:hypothetical protein
MLRKIKQILNDHKAMNVLREGNGDVHLELFVGGQGVGWDCRLFQRNETYAAADPAVAILRANIPKK